MVPQITTYKRHIPWTPAPPPRFTMPWRISLKVGNTGVELLETPNEIEARAKHRQYRECWSGTQYPVYLISPLGSME